LDIEGIAEGALSRGSIWLKEIVHGDFNAALQRDLMRDRAMALKASEVKR
jgi:hypothetical protein